MSKVVTGVTSLINNFLSEILSEIEKKISELPENPDKLQVLSKIHEVFITYDINDSGNQVESFLNSCTFTLKTGPRKGERCKGKISTKNPRFCSRHLPKGCMFRTAEHKLCNGPIVTNSNGDITEFCKEHLPIDHLTINVNKWGHLEHKPTGLIFQDKKVIGKQGDSKVLLPLSDQDLENIFNYSFPLDEKLMETMRDYLLRRHSEVIEITLE